MAKPEIDLVIVQRTLTTRRAELVPRVLERLGEASEPASWDPRLLEPSAVDVDALLDRFDGPMLRELARIDAALGRIEVGTYGRCVSCGAMIDVDRLLSLPEATLCADCGQLELGVPAPPGMRR